jgi:hypothetical protein
MKYSKEQLQHVYRSDCLNFENFDKKYNVDTASPIVPVDSEPDIMRPSAYDNTDVVPGSEGYQPIPLHWIDIINRFFEQHRDKNLRFVDIGSGKGKPMLYSLLNNAPYSEYICIEADKVYADICKQNLVTTNINIDKPVTVLEMDAFDFDYSQNDNMYCLFQPFSIDLFQKFLDKNWSKLQKTNSYMACIMVDAYDVEKRFVIPSVFSEGFVYIYEFGKEQQ